MTIPQDQIALLRSHSLPVCVDGEMAFREPWEAKAFAIAVTLSQTGRFTWSEWVDCFSMHVAAATKVEADGGVPKTYYQQWVDAIEELLVAKGMTSREQLVAKRLGALLAPTLHRKVATPPRTD